MACNGLFSSQPSSFCPSSAVVCEGLSPVTSGMGVSDIPITRQHPWVDGIFPEVDLPPRPSWELVPSDKASERNTFLVRIIERNGPHNWALPAAEGRLPGAESSQWGFMVWMHFPCLKDAYWQCVALPVAAAVFICWSQSVYFEGLCNKHFTIAIGTAAEMIPQRKEASTYSCFLYSRTVWISGYLFLFFVVCVYTYKHVCLIFTSKGLNYMMPH